MHPGVRIALAALAAALAGAAALYCLIAGARKTSRERAQRAAAGAAGAAGAAAGAAAGRPRFSVRASLAALQNRRDAMEDVTFSRQCGRRWLGAVMDGHGGAAAARVCERLLSERCGALEACVDVERWARELVAECDRVCARDVECGCTIVLCVVSLDSGDCMCAWVGDSGAVFCTEADFAAMYEPHKPDVPEEQLRIEKAGGFVSNGRVNGVLAMSRSIGDRALKPSVCADPGVFWVHPDREFSVVLFSDGLSDVMSDVLIAKACAEGYSPEEIASVAIKEGSTDNISILMASFLYSD
jgi:serine/threonine protein phosphatase PrpC